MVGIPVVARTVIYGTVVNGRRVEVDWIVVDVDRVDGHLLDKMDNYGTIVIIPS